MCDVITKATIKEQRGKRQRDPKSKHERCDGGAKEDIKEKSQKKSERWKYGPPERGRQNEWGQQMMLSVVQAVRQAGGWWFLCVIPISGGKASKENVRGSFSFSQKERPKFLKTAMAVIMPAA